MDENFSTKVELDYYSYDPEDQDFCQTKYVSVKWRPVFEYRSWGIKTITAAIPAQQFVLEFIDDEGEGDGYERTIECDHVEVEYSQSSSTSAGGFVPVAIEMEKKGAAYRAKLIVHTSSS